MVDKRFLASVEKFYQSYRFQILQKQKGKFVHKKVNYDILNGLKVWENYSNFYSEWLRKVKTNLSDNEIEQLKTIKDVKDEEYNAKHKP